MNKKALIAMSGGVDSSVCAYLMKEKEYECVGAMMKLFQVEDLGLKEEHGCCTQDDVADAQSVADRLKMPFYLMDFSERFRECVLEQFVCAYEEGKTPNPCVSCNRHLKFEKLFAAAQEMGCDYVATGHYVQSEYCEATGRYLLRQAKDKSKDQSYVLYSLTQEQLSHAMFPLGGFEKSEAREIAEAQGFVNARKHDSQDICFVKDESYTDFIERYRQKTYPAGNFVDMEGHILGRHKGIIHYTIGQRKGLGLALKKPMYVVKLDTEKNEVILGDNADLFSTTLTAHDINLISVAKIEGEMRVKAKVRYRHEAQWATVTQPEEDTLVVVFDEPQRAITKGQAVVMYDGDLVVGGGTIAEL